MFRPEFNEAGLPIPHRRPVKSPHIKHGEITERIYDALRAGGSVTDLEIAAAAMHEKGLDPDDPVIRADFVRRIRLQLAAMARSGKIERIMDGKVLRWKTRLAAGPYRLI
jgi:hypothetical protein